MTKIPKIIKHLFFNQVWNIPNADNSVYLTFDDGPTPEITEKFLEILEATYNEKDCKMCINKVPEEGIILRVEKLEYYEAYKLKSKRFLLMESEEQEKEVSNIEDNQE
jgi:hypothetical protein